MVFADGRVVQLLDECRVANGVKGYNSISVHVAYTGGVDASGKPVDNRTDAQKKFLLYLLKVLRRAYPNAQIVGHRDLAAKACPSFDAKAEYSSL